MLGNRTQIARCGRRWHVAAFLIATCASAGTAFASESPDVPRSPQSPRVWYVDGSNPAQPAQIGASEARAATGNTTRRMLRTPTLEVTAPETKSRQTVVVRKTVPRYVPQRLRFDRVSIVGNPVEPRIRFQRDPEIFSMDGIKGEKIRGDFLRKVADDLNP